MSHQPAQPSAADLYSFDEWITRPPLGKTTVQAGNRGPITVAIRADDVDDNEWVLRQLRGQELDGQEREMRQMELLLSRCIIAIRDGRGEDIDLLTIPVPDEPPYSTTDIRKLRKLILEGQWTLLVTVFSRVRYTAPEPSAPSSPES